jgi:hypothetical protein
MSRRDGILRLGNMMIKTRRNVQDIRHGLERFSHLIQLFLSNMRP